MICALHMIYSPTSMKMFLGVVLQGKSFPFKSATLVSAQTLNKCASDNMKFTSDDVLVRIKMQSS